jgi:glycosyltransferase involved in cell wall biosynthesis
MHSGILFLTLRVFSATGGIEKVCKVVCKALDELKDEKQVDQLSVLSMYDTANDVDEKYLKPTMFNGYSQQKISFVRDALKQGLNSKVVILSHINLLSIGYLIKLFSPKTKLVLFAHGIEVWGPVSGIRKKMLNSCDLILSVSQYTKDKMAGELGLDEKKITVFNNCLDPYLPAPLSTGKDTALKVQYGIADDAVVLMTLTRLSSKELYKGYDHVLYALNQLKSQYPQIKYLIIGRYDAGEKSRLDAIIEKYSLQPYVVFTGYINDEELARHYSLADIYVMPSKKEGFGIVFIEAMYYGLPVIAGNKDGSVDALCNGRLGILVNPDDQDEINHAIKKMIQEKDQYLPDNTLVMERFSYTSYKNKLKQIVHSLFSLFSCVSICCIA